MTPEQARAPLKIRIQREKGSHYDFFFHVHELGVKHFLGDLKYVIEKNKHNVLILEDATAVREGGFLASRKFWENLHADGIKKAPHINELFSWPREKLWAVNTKTGEPADEMILQSLAKTYGMRIKIGEEHEKSRRASADAEHRRLGVAKSRLDRGLISEKEFGTVVVKELAMHLWEFDSSIARTIKRVEDELMEDPTFKHDNVRALVIFGTAHRNIEKIFSKLTRGRTGVVKFGPEGITEVPWEYYLKAIELAEKGETAIEKWIGFR
ncbi:MAG: hypothetical protein HY544_02500 [Candidatus Diapherotrites archaeon]|uniref:Uncharacterized protein n=1 Tax=Candidatus Iainarchaeum sp. TaxID=3101447 RepID=A0A8T3YII7_9ARCH|nr:hypothetical protein [Candidatus Diapherotrites archaeon]